MPSKADPMTTPPINEAERAKAMELCAKATAGPWKTRDQRTIAGVDGPGSTICLHMGWLPDADFIAFSRTAIPAYEARVVELEAALAVTQAKLLVADTQRMYCPCDVGTGCMYPDKCWRGQKDRAEAAEARATAAEGRIRHAENSAALMLQERERFAREKLAAEAKLKLLSELKNSMQVYVFEQRALLRTTEERATALLEALRPFAEQADVIAEFDGLSGIGTPDDMSIEDGSDSGGTNLTVGDLRAARAAILAHGGKDEPRS